MPDDLDWQGQNPPGPQTDRRLKERAKTDPEFDDLGRSDELEGDGDIADETPGRRG